MRRGITTWLSRQLIAAALQCSLSFLVLAANALDGHVHPHRAAALPCNRLRRAPLDSGVEAQGSFPCRILDRKSTRLNSSHLVISYAVFCLKKKKKTQSGRTSTTTA